MGDRLVTTSTSNSRTVKEKLFTKTILPPYEPPFVTTGELDRVVSENVDRNIDSRNLVTQTEVHSIVTETVDVNIDSRNLATQENVNTVVADTIDEIIDSRNLVTQATVNTIVEEAVTESVGDLSTTVSGFDSRIQQVEISVSALTTSVDGFEIRVQDFEITTSNITSSLVVLDTKVNATDSKIDSNVATLTTSLSNLDTRVQELGATSETFTTSLSEFNASLQGLETSSETLATSLADLDTKVDGLETAVGNAEVVSTNLSTTVGTFVSRIQSVEDATTSLTSAAGETNSRVEFLEASNITLTATVANIEAITTTTQTNITTLSQTVDGLTTRIQNTETNVTTFSGSLGDINSDIQSINDSVSSITSRVDELETNNPDVTSLTTRVDELETDVPLIRTDVTSLTTRVGDLETNNPDVTSLTTRVDELETAVPFLRTDVTSLTTRVVELETDVPALDADVTSLATRVVVLETDVPVVRTDVTSLTTRVVVLETDVPALRADVTSITSRVVELETDVPALEVDVTSLTTRVVELETDVPALEVDVTSLTTRVVELETDVPALETDVTSLATRVVELETDVPVLRTDVTSLTTRVVVLETDVPVLRTDVTALTTRATTIEGNAVSLQTDVEDLTVRVSTAEAAVISLNQTTITTNSTVEDLDAKADAIDIRVQTLDSTVQSHQTSIGQLQTTSSSNTSRITTVETDLGTLQTNFANVPSDIAAIENRTQTLETDSQTLQDDVETLQGDVEALQTATAGSGTPDNIDGTLVKRNNVSGTKMGLTQFNDDILLQKSGSSRWAMSLDAIEGSNNTGSNLAVKRYTTEGTLIDTPINVERSTGTVRINSLQLTTPLQGNIVGSSSSFTDELQGDIIGNIGSTAIAPGVITNEHFSELVVFDDARLNTIITPGKVSNSATTATSESVTNSIVSRNADGDFFSRTVYANIDSEEDGTLNVGATNASTVNLAVSSSMQVVNIGTGASITTINIGGPGDTVNIAGTLVTTNSQDIVVTNKNITLNQSGANGSAAGAGILVEENGATAASILLDNIRSGWLFSVPDNPSTASFDLSGGNNIVIQESSHHPVTLGTVPNGLVLVDQTLSLGVASGSQSGAMSSATFNEVVRVAAEVDNASSQADETNDGLARWEGGTLTGSFVGDIDGNSSGFTDPLSGDITGTMSNTQIAPGVIVNADINDNANINDSKLANITSAGKVLNSATTATHLNTPSAIVARDANGAFTAGIIIATLDGNSKGFTDSLAGDIGGTMSNTQITPGVIVNADINDNANIADTKLANITSTGKVSNTATTATNLNTANAIVSRDINGAFSAGIITATLNGNAKGFTDSLAGDIGGTMSNTQITPGVIVNTDISATANIADTKLANITSAGKVANTATTATNANTPSAIVARDINGAFTATTITATLNGNATGFTSSLSGDITGTMSNTQIAPGVIVNADISATAAIDDTKLANITSAGKVANTATTATNANTPSAIVARDINGAFTATTITATLNGNATGFTSSLAGDIGGTMSNTQITSGVIINTDINDNANISDSKLANITTAGKVANTATTATNLNTPSSIVARDASGAFTATTITAALNGNSTGFTSSLAGDITGTMSNTQIAPGVIVNADVSATAAIVDTKLANITSAGKVANSATTATSDPTVSAIMMRDPNGDVNTRRFITRGLSMGGYATGLAYSSILMTGGNTSGSLFPAYNTYNEGIHLGYNYSMHNNPSMDPSVLNAAYGCSRITVASNAINLAVSDVGVAPDRSQERLNITTSAVTALNGAIFTGNGSGLTTLNASAVTSGQISNSRLNSSTANTANTVVIRDANGSFSAAVVTASLSGNVTGTGASTFQTMTTNLTTGAHWSLRNGSLMRFALGLNIAETGSGNGGGDLQMWAYDDVGNFLNGPLSVTRSTGLVSIPKLSSTTLTATTVSAGGAGTFASLMTTAGTSAGGVSHLVMTSLNASRWIFGNIGAETSGNVGSDLYISTFGGPSGAQTFIGTPLTITRATGLVTIPNLSATTLSATNFSITNLTTTTLTTTTIAGNPSLTGTLSGLASKIQNTMTNHVAMQSRTGQTPVITGTNLGLRFSCSALWNGQSETYPTLFSVLLNGINTNPISGTIDIISTGADYYSHRRYVIFCNGAAPPAAQMISETTNNPGFYDVVPAVGMSGGSGANRTLTCTLTALQYGSPNGVHISADVSIPYLHGVTSYQLNT